MPKSEGSRIEVLEALIAERRKHEGYLAKLEERRATTPEHVYTRLRDEYATKLTDLQVRAAAEAESLAGGIAAEEAAVADIEERLSAVVEERIEGELRAEVGEYEPKEWSRKLTVLNATIAQLEKERDQRAGSFARIRELIEDATSAPHGGGEPGAGASSAPAAPAGTAAKPAPRASGAGPAMTDGREGPSAPAPAGSPRPASGAPPMAGGPSFDELAFLNSVVGRASAPAIQPPAPPRTPRSATPVRTSEPAVPAASREPTRNDAPAQPVAEPSSAPSADPPSAPVREPATAPRASQAVRAPDAPPAAPASPPPPAAPPEDEPPSPLGRPTPRTSQAIKTLKCQECGTLNYPTEWYCERCGGELAAL